jgi:hypothetical protein
MKNPVDVTPGAADYRRAAALIAHYGRNDNPGIGEIMAETAETGRPLPLILALLAVFNEVIPEMRTPLGMNLLSDYVLRLAGMEAGEGE